MGDGCWVLVDSLCGDADGEYGAMGLVVGRGYGAAHEFGVLLDDAQANAAALVAAVQLVGVIEAFEDVGEVFLADAFASVGNAQVESIAVFGGFQCA